MPMVTLAIIVWSVTAGLCLGFHLAEKSARAVLQARHDRDIAEVNARLEHSRALLAEAVQVLQTVSLAIEHGRLPDNALVKAMERGVRETVTVAPSRVSPLRSIKWGEWHPTPPK